MNKYFLVLLLALTFSAYAAPPDFTGQWMLDIKRSDAWPTNPPFTPAGKNKFANYNPDKHDSAKFCMPYGMPRVMEALAASPMEILQTAKQITLLFEAHDEVRRIFLLEASHPAQMSPSWSGYSIGHWQGATLVVDTRGLIDESLLSTSGLQHSDALHITERISRMENGQTLKDVLTLIDEDTYTKPLKVTRYYRLIHDVIPSENDCATLRWSDRMAGYARAAMLENKRQRQTQDESKGEKK